MKKTKGLLVVPAVLLAATALSSCNAGGSRYLDVNNSAEDKAKLYSVLENYEGLEKSKVLNEVGVSLNVNSLNATGDYSIYEKSDESAAGYKVRTLKNAIFNVENYKAVETTIPNWLLQSIKFESGGGGGSEPTVSDVIYDYNVDYDTGEAICSITGDAPSGCVLKVNDSYVDENTLSSYPVTNVDASSLNYKENVVGLSFIHPEDSGIIEPVKDSSFTIDSNLIGLFPYLRKIYFNQGYIYETVIFGDYSCANNTSLNCIEVNSSLNLNIEVGEGAFEGCTSLRIYGHDYTWEEDCDSINFFNSITNIGNYAFSGCTNLKGDLTEKGDCLDLKKINSIGENAFSTDQKNGIEYVASLPAQINLYNVTNLSKGCFAGHIDQHATILNFSFVTENVETLEYVYGAQSGETKTLVNDGSGEEGFPSANEFLNQIFETPHEEFGFISLLNYLVYDEFRKEDWFNSITITRTPEQKNNISNKNTNKLTSSINLISNSSNNDEEEEEESPMLEVSYILCFPLRREIAYYLIGTEAYGEPWQKMKTNFYLETSASGNEHINFDIQIDSLSDFVSEFTEKTFGSSILPFDGTGSLYASVKTDDFGFVKSLDLKVNGEGISFSTGDARKIRPNNNSLSLINSNGSIIESLFSGGFKFSGKLNLDINAQLNHTYSDSKDAIFYQTYEKDGKLVTEARTDDKYTLRAQQVSVNPFNDTKIYADSATAIYENNTYNVTIVPSKIKDSDKYYVVDDDNCYISVNGVKVGKVTSKPNESISADYCCIYPLTSAGGEYTAYKVSIGRGFVNRIKSTLGSDAIFQINIGIKEGE